MKIAHQSATDAVLVFSPGEEVVSGILDFARAENITGATIAALGGLSDVTLNFYDTKKQDYIPQVFDDGFELVSAVGNLTVHEGSPTLHLHGVVSDRAYQSFGGHISEMHVSATCEVMIRILPEALHRAKDEETGLTTLQSV